MTSRQRPDGAQNPRVLSRRALLGSAAWSGLFLFSGNGFAKEQVMTSSVSNNTPLVAFPGPWSFLLPKSSIILVSDQELETLARDPDQPINLSLDTTPRMQSLRSVCEAAQAAGHRTLIVAFDQFFTQYRPGQNAPRKLMPDSEEYIKLIATIGQFAQKYGLALELSLLSPLEIGPSYVKQTGESGIWMHYRKGLRDPATGAYSVQLWRQQRWTNNKGPIRVEDAGVRVFAFRQNPLYGTPYLVVDPKTIVEITDTAHVEIMGPTEGSVEAVRVRIYGRGQTDIGPLDRVLVVQIYRTPEMDYFSEKALPYLKNLVDRYVDAGVKLNGLYSDEMHIQQDWDYFHHHDHGEFAMRYVSPGLVRAFAAKYGNEYQDFAKYLLYFVHGQEDKALDLTAKEGAMHVFGSTPEDIHATALFRARYYHLLQDGVVALFTEAKRHAEQRMGHPLEARAHATWAESPTIDYWRVGQEPDNPAKYEYTSNFVWSNTVQQAAAACYDYFSWGDFLTGNGNDHAEGGYADRDYFALALACSTGILNTIPYSYAAYWGMPGPVADRRGALVDTYGDAGSPFYGMVQDMQHRDVDVLMLYPIDLVAVEERFGSWMTLYGYANYVTQAKLLERGRVVGGAIEMAGRRFSTLVTLFEPFPSQQLLSLIRQMLQAGGRVIWSGPPPLLSNEGQPILTTWSEIFGVSYTPSQEWGKMVPGREVRFAGLLKNVSPQIILTHLLPDRIYPVIPQKSVEAIASVQNQVVGTHRSFPNGGSAVFLGYRPRDDQAASLGYETRNWFEVLTALGAYPPTGRFAHTNDNTEYLSRTTDYLCCRFPNGAIAIARHFRHTPELWQGGFARDPKADQDYLQQHPLPSSQLQLKNFHVHGHTITYEGDLAVTFRVDDRHRMVAFAGRNANRIEVDGHTTVFADTPMPLVAWAPVPPECRVPHGAILRIFAVGEGTVRIPLLQSLREVQLFVEGPQPGSRGDALPVRIEGDVLVFTLTSAHSGRWLYAVPQS
ncbi:hypothetical protein CTKA_00521 [Chthonomonas calidirosea]|nr:hypothetical protein [Chthonomonas calidirosea]CEK14720.1 hypothetical protein CTKA_00521 [Chthonomonas calidirosea]